MIKKLREIEDDYLKLFTRRETIGDLVFFHNDDIRGMYDHNFVLIREIKSEHEFKMNIANLLDDVKNKGKDFLKIVLHPEIQLNTELLKWINQLGFGVSNIIYMMASSTTDRKSEALLDCSVRRANSNDDIKDGLYCAKQYSLTHRDQELSRKKISQREGLYLDQSIGYYVCYDQGNPIGYCDWFQKEGIVKLEEFTVLDEYQGKGFGTAMLDQMLSDASEQGVNQLYLITREEDQAKKLYDKMGFKIVGKETNLFYAANSSL